MQPPDEDFVSVLKEEAQKIHPLKEKHQHYTAHFTARPRKIQHLNNTQKPVPVLDFGESQGKIAHSSGFLQHGVPAKTLRDLKNGKIPIQKQLDLHGLDRDEAWQTLENFFAECFFYNIRRVKIIHGKGLNSPSAPVLKNLTQNFLQNHPLVLGFASPNPSLGADGATVVLLRNKNKIDC